MVWFIGVAAGGEFEVDIYVGVRGGGGGGVHGVYVMRLYVST